MVLNIAIFVQKKSRTSSFSPKSSLSSQVFKYFSVEELKILRFSQQHDSAGVHCFMAFPVSANVLDHHVTDLRKSVAFARFTILLYDQDDI